MTNRPAPFRQSDVCRAVKGAKAAGVEVKRVEVDPSGKIIIVSTRETFRRGTRATTTMTSGMTF
jgi:hypothetical protein